MHGTKLFVDGESESYIRQIIGDDLELTVEIEMVTEIADVAEKRDVAVFTNSFESFMASVENCFS